MADGPRPGGTTTSWWGQASADPWPPFACQKRASASSWWRWVSAGVAKTSQDELAAAQGLLDVGPRFGTGIQRLTLLRDVLVLHGTGVGGGSLVYANTLMVPNRQAFQDPKWRDLNDWEQTLAPHYETARRMLGVTVNPKLTPADEALREIATEMGCAKPFTPRT